MKTIALMVGVLLFIPWMLDAQDMKSFAFHTDATSGEGDEVDITGLSLIGVTVSGSVTSNRAATFEVADNIGTYSSVKCTNIETLGVVDTITLSGTTPHRFQCPVGGFKKFRVRISGGTTGTLTAVGLGLARAQVSPRGTATSPPGGGNVSVSGTPTVGQLALWVDDTHIQGITSLPVTSGGSGTTTLAEHGVLLGHGGAPFTSIPPSGNGLCLMSALVNGTTTDPTFQTCPSGTATLDFGNNGSIESTAIHEVAITGDTTSIFTEPSNDKLLIDVSKKWPSAQAADALAALGVPCAPGDAARGIDTAGNAAGCFTPAGAGSSAFHAITTGTNTTAAMVCDAGCTLDPAGAGRITANALSGAITVPSGASLMPSGVGSIIANGLTGTIVIPSGTSVTTSGTGTNNANVFKGSTVIAAADGGTGMSVPMDDTILVGTGTEWQLKVLPECNEAAGQVVKYGLASNAWSCVTLAGVSLPFSAITAGTNVQALVIEGSLTATGLGSISATALSPSFVLADTNIPHLNVLSTGLIASKCVETDGSGNLSVAAGPCGVASGTVTFTGTPVAGQAAEWASSSAIQGINTTGTGSYVKALSPVLTTPNLGTPVAVVLTSATGLPLTTGVTGTLPVGSGGTNLTTAPDDTVMVGNGTLWQEKLLPDCTSGGGRALNYTAATNTWSCGTGVVISGTPTAGQAAEWVNATTVAGVAGTGTGSYVKATSPTLVTPLLGTPTSVTLTNATGLPVSTGLAGLGSGIASWLATPSSATLAAALTDETGTGPAVFATSPFFITPNLGTPAAGILTNATGLPVSTGLAGVGSGIAPWLGVPSSANLAAALTDETGSGAAVFASSPVLQAPALGTPSAVVLTNATGLPFGAVVSGTSSTAAMVIDTGSSLSFANAGSINASLLGSVPASEYLTKTNVVKVSGKQHVARRVLQTIAGDAFTIDIDATDIAEVPVLTVGVTVNVSAGTGTNPEPYQDVDIVFAPTAAPRSITWSSAIVESMGILLPTATTGDNIRWDMVKIRWFSTPAKWVAIAKTTGVEPGITTLPSNATYTCPHLISRSCEMQNTGGAGNIDIGVPSGGTPANGKQLVLKVQCTAAQTLTLNTGAGGFVASPNVPITGLTCPAVGPSWTAIAVEYSTVFGKWQVYATN